MLFRSGGGAGAESANLREDEPHPVSAFAAGAQLGDDLRVDWRLRGDESLQIEGLLVGRVGVVLVRVCHADL